MDVPIDTGLRLAEALVTELGPEAPASVPAAVWGSYLTHTRGEKHPEREKLQAMALALLAACARARGVEADKFRQWMEREGLNDRARFGPALDEALEAMVPEDEWLFDRSLVPAPPWGKPQDA